MGKLAKALRVSPADLLEDRVSLCLGAKLLAIPGCLEAGRELPPVPSEPPKREGPSARGPDLWRAPALFLGLDLGKITRRDPFRHQRQKIVRLLERLNSPVVLVVAVAVFLILDGFLLYRYQQSLRSPEESASNAPIQESTTSPKAETTPTEETTSSPKVEPTPAKETTSSLEEEDGVRVVVEVAGAGGVGLSILEDGQLAYDQVAGSGFSEEFEAEEAVTVTTADAGPVRVGVNGEDPEALGASGEQVTRTFTPES